MRSESASKNTMSRRAFVAASTAAAAAMAAAGTAPENALAESAQEAPTEATEPVEPQAVWNIDAELAGNGEWKTALCSFSCGGSCFNQVYTEDGIILRQKTDDLDPDTPECPQRRSCPRGRSLQQMTFGADRLKYPMKRKSWNPDNPTKDLRGRDEWERLSWDEALDYVADFLQNTIDTYGNEAILGSNGTGSRGLAAALNLMGGYVSVFEPCSFGSSNTSNGFIGLPPAYYYGTMEGNDRFDMANADTIVLYSCNPAWASAGNPNYYLYNIAKEGGKQFVYVGPSRNLTAQLVDARWIPVRPGTDTAFLLAVVYEMFELERTQGDVIDWEFLEKYTYGIDLDHMAPGVEATGSLYDSVCGNFDGVVKTAEWAAEICGCSPEDIRFYADLMRKGNKTSVFYSYAAARCNDSEYWTPLMYSIAFMGGHVGKPGEQITTAYHAGAWREPNPGAPWLYWGAEAVDPAYSVNPLPIQIVTTEEWDALEGKEVPTAPNRLFLDGTRTTFQPDFKMVFFDGGAGLNNCTGLTHGIKALREGTAECVVATGFAFTPECAYADIVLPKQTLWEQESAAYWDRVFTYTDAEALYDTQRVVEPMYEALDERDIWSRLLEKMGLNPAEAYPASRKQVRYELLSGAVLYDNTFDPKPALTITQEDIDRLGVEGTPQEGVCCTLEEFESRGLYKLEVKAGDNFQYFQHAAYLNDPENNPQPTPSGRWELYSEPFAKCMNDIGNNPDFEWQPFPIYKPALHGYEEGQAGEHKFQLYTPHYLRRQHSKSDNLPWLREALQNPVWINNLDAEALGIKTGDTVKLFNQFGACLRKASVMGAIMPGCVSIPHGAWVDMDEELGVDLAGSANVLTPDDASGSGISAYNTVLVSIEKWDGDELDDDWQMPQRIVGCQA